MLTTLNDKHHSTKLSLKQGTGHFEGYASIFGKKDAGGDIVLRGAFTESLKKRKPADVKLLYQHNPTEPIGVWKEIREDRTGLYVIGQLALDVSRAREVYALMQIGALDGLSIGFQALAGKRNNKTGIRYLHKIDLWEISIVTFPMLTGARIGAVKYAQNTRTRELQKITKRLRQSNHPS